jgi:hypothetical protein
MPKYHIAVESIIYTEHTVETDSLAYAFSMARVNAVRMIRNSKGNIAIEEQRDWELSEPNLLKEDE